MKRELAQTVEMAPVSALTSTAVTYGAETECGECHHSNIDSTDSRGAKKVPGTEKVPCAEPGPSPTFTACIWETLACGANRSTDSVAHSANGAINDTALAKSWTKREIGA